MKGFKLWLCSRCALEKSLNQRRTDNNSVKCEESGRRSICQQGLAALQRLSAFHLIKTLTSSYPPPSPPAPPPPPPFSHLP